MVACCSAMGERIALSQLGSANLVRPGFCPNGPSNTASRHRLRRAQRKGPAPIASHSAATVRLSKREQLAWWIKAPCSLLKRPRLGGLLPSQPPSRGKGNKIKGC
jgi:hypothetical protein